VEPDGPTAETAGKVSRTNDFVVGVLMGHAGFLGMLKRLISMFVPFASR